MTGLTEKNIVSALGSIIDPTRGKDIVSLGMVSGVSIRDGHVSFAIEIAPGLGETMEPVRLAAEKAVAALPGVAGVSAVLFAEKPDPRQAHAHSQQEQPERLLESVKVIIAVASGKGGVGKSTTATNLALAFREMGLSVGMFDADIYGPSQPRLLGVSTVQPRAIGDGTQLLPVEAYGLKVMSIGFLIPEDDPVVWRGPMVMGALEQLMRDVLWGPLDVMIVDMPPGTGDTQLTMTQRVPLSGAVIVSTPQDIALIDARKGLNMFRAVHVPVLGIIENMSIFHCPQCGHETPIFGHGGAEAEAARLGVDFLGALPLDIAIRTTSDDGLPIVLSKPDSPAARIYKDIAARLWAKTGSGDDSPQGPKIVMS